MNVLSLAMRHRRADMFNKQFFCCMFCFGFSQIDSDYPYDISFTAIRYQWSSQQIDCDYSLWLFLSSMLLSDIIEKDGDFHLLNFKILLLGDSSILSELLHSVEFFNDSKLMRLLMNLWYSIRLILLFVLSYIIKSVPLFSSLLISILPPKAFTRS